MKIYSNDKNLINRSVDVYGSVVRFDRTGCAEVEDKEAKNILKLAPNSFTDKPIEDEKVDRVDDNKSIDQLRLEVEIANSKIEKLKIQDESRKKVIGDKDLEIKQVREALGTLSKEKGDLDLKIETLSLASEGEVDDFKTKYELALKGLSELKAACSTLEIPEEQWKSLKSEDKDKIIDLIVKATK